MPKQWYVKPILPIGRGREVKNEDSPNRARPEHDAIPRNFGSSDGHDVSQAVLEDTSEDD